VKRKERDEDAEAEKKKQINISLSVRRDLSSRSLQCAHVEGARASWNALVQQNQPQKQNKTPDREIDRDLPRRGRAIAASPNTDKQKSWDERELVEGVKEKQVQGRKSADCSARDKKEAGVKRSLVMVDLIGEPDRCQRDDRRQQQHDQAKAVQSDGEVQLPIRKDWERTNEPKPATRCTKIEDRGE